MTYYLDRLPDNIWVTSFHDLASSTVHADSRSISNQKLVHKNLAMFKIPAKALNEPRIPDYIDSLMRDILTKQHGMIMQKVHSDDHC